MRKGSIEELATVVEQLATHAPSKEESLAGFLNLARVYSKRLGSKERAAAAYERALDLSPGHPEATSALVDFFTSRELWDHLVALYDEQLVTARSSDEAGTVLQVAMVHWKMRKQPTRPSPTSSASESSIPPTRACSASSASGRRSMAVRPGSSGSYQEARRVLARGTRALRA